MAPAHLWGVPAKIVEELMLKKNNWYGKTGNLGFWFLKILIGKVSHSDMFRHGMPKGIKSQIGAKTHKFKVKICHTI